MFTLLRGGYHTRPAKEFSLARPQGISNYVILLLKTPVLFEIEDRIYHVATNSIMIIPPNPPYRYSVLDIDFQNDWMHFDCEEDSFKDAFSHLFSQPIPVRNSMQFSQYFQHILWEYHYACPEFRQQNVDMLFQIMMNKLLQEHQEWKSNENYTPYASALQELRLTMQSQPSKNFTPQELAKNMNVSPSYFQHLYKDFFGIPFKKDLIDMRLNYACSLISDTPLTFEQIAYTSGYTNEIHFYRQFKKKAGMTPGEYRISMGSLSQI